MLIRYQAYFNQKGSNLVKGTVLVILLERRLMVAFMKRIVKRMISRGLQVTWSRLKEYDESNL